MSGGSPRRRKRVPMLAPLPAFPICEDPIFIIGSPRSGTSILAMSLAHHARLWSSHESDLLFNVFGGGRASEPWKQWPNEEKAIFLEEVLPTLRKHQLHTDDQLATFLD